MIPLNAVWKTRLLHHLQLQDSSHIAKWPTKIEGFLCNFCIWNLLYIFLMKGSQQIDQCVVHEECLTA